MKNIKDILFITTQVLILCILYILVNRYTHQVDRMYALMYRYADQAKVINLLATDINNKLDSIKCTLDR